MTLFRWHSDSPDRSRALAAALASACPPGATIALDGPMGAGKTLFVRAFAEALGVDPNSISSPTYVIVNEYTAADGTRLAHADASRLASPDELETAGLDALDPDTIVLIEWASQVPDALPADALRLDLRHAGPDERAFIIRAPGAWEPAVAAIAERFGIEPAPSPPPPAQDRHATTCPVTGEPVAHDSPTWPFASERARLVDLHRWFSGAYTLERPIEPDDLDNHG